MTPPAEDDVAAATTSGSITGSAMPPAKAVEADTANIAAATNFFILFPSRPSPAERALWGVLCATPHMNDY
jgi:hypothetical protein